MWYVSLTGTTTIVSIILVALYDRLRCATSASKFYLIYTYLRVKNIVNVLSCSHLMYTYCWESRTVLMFLAVLFTVDVLSQKNCSLKLQNVSSARKTDCLHLCPTLKLFPFASNTVLGTSVARMWRKLWTSFGSRTAISGRVLWKRKCIHNCC